MLSDFTEYCNDSIGVTSSIWDRIKKVGEDRFYRVEYKSDDDYSITDPDKKREMDKNYVEGTGEDGGGLIHLIDTTIADTDYVKNVIEAFVNKNKKFENKLYYETK